MGHNINSNYLYVSIIIDKSDSNKNSKFNNKSYDPYGSGLRFFQSRDDTGSSNTTLEDRQVGGEQIFK